MRMASFYSIHQLRAQLADLDAAIEAARSGASYSIGGRSVTRATLPDLEAQRTRVMRDIKRTDAVLEGVRDPSAAVATWSPWTY